MANMKHSTEQEIRAAAQALKDYQDVRIRHIAPAARRWLRRRGMVMEHTDGYLRARGPVLSRLACIAAGEEI